MERAAQEERDRERLERERERDAVSCTRSTIDCNTGAVGRNAPAGPTKRRSADRRCQAERVCWLLQTPAPGRVRCVGSNI